MPHKSYHLNVLLTSCNNCKSRCKIADDTTKTTNNDRVLFVTSKITNLAILILFLQEKKVTKRTKKRI